MSESVVKSPDFDRVKSLVFREPSTRVDSRFAAQRFDSIFRQLGGEQTLRPIQGHALDELEKTGGLFGSIAVGAGKTLISFLASAVVDAQRPLLLVPASLRDLTQIRYNEALAHWKLPGLVIKSYSELSVKSGKDFLDQYKPDLIIADEAHKLAHPTATRTKRFLRFMANNPECRFVCLSGTLTKRSIEDYAHLITLALGNGAPVPLDYWELRSWSQALSDKVRPEEYVNPGILHTLCPAGEDCKHQRLQSHAREAFRYRLVNTPGVICSDESDVGASLCIKMIHTLRGIGSSPIQQAIERLERDWELPSGEEVSDPLEMYRQKRALSWGYEFAWETDAPIEWMQARKAWKAFVSEKCRHSRLYDSEALLIEACESGRVNSGGLWEEWKTIKPTFTPVPVAKWYTDEVVDSIFEFFHGHEVTDAWLIWTDSIPLGEKIAERLDVPYFGAGVDEGEFQGAFDSGVPMVLSIQAHGTGRNLQARCQNLILTPPSNGSTWEQLIGRTHRPGQKSDEVLFEVFAHTEPMREAFVKACDQAQYVMLTTGQNQKLLKASIF